MHADQSKSEPRQPDRVQRIKPSERNRTDLLPTAEHLPDKLPNDRSGASNFYTDHRCPIRFLIPRQQVTGETESQYNQEHQDPSNPRHLSWRFIGGVRYNAQQVQEHDNHHRTGTPMVQAPHKAAEHHLLADVVHSVISVVRRRRIVKR